MEPNATPRLNPKYIKLAGQEWPITLLAPRQQRVILPTMDQYRDMADKARPVPGSPGKVTLPPEHYDILLKMVHTALTREHPKLGYEEFLDMPITYPELVAAVPIIMECTGLTVEKPKANGSAGGPEEGAQDPSIGIG